MPCALVCVSSAALHHAVHCTLYVLQRRSGDAAACRDPIPWMRTESHLPLAVAVTVAKLRRTPSRLAKNADQRQAQEQEAQAREKDCLSSSSAHSHINSTDSLSALMPRTPPFAAMAIAVRRWAQALQILHCLVCSGTITTICIVN